MKLFFATCLLSLLAGFWATVSLLYRIALAAVLTGIVLLILNILFCEMWNGALAPMLGLHLVPFWKDFLLVWITAIAMQLAYWFTRPSE
jgi:hypothetical protein